MVLSYNQLKLLTQILATSGIISSLVGLHIIKKYKEQTLKYQQLFEVTQYLAHVIEENNVELTEFDCIALKDLGVLTIVEESV